MEVTIDGVRYIPQRKHYRLEQSLGDLVKMRRKVHKWTLQNLAEAAGLSKSTVWEIENDRNSPSFAVAARLATVLGIDLDDMAATIPYSNSLREKEQA